MKCIQCSTDNTLKDRTDNQGRCKNCNHPFAFEPTSITNIRLKVTDPLFAKAISDISAENTLFFTPKQLFYLLDKRLERKAVTPGMWVLFCSFFTLFLGMFVSAIMGGSDRAFIIGLGIGITILIGVCLIGSSSTKNSNRNRRKYAISLQSVGGLIIGGGILYSLGLSSDPNTAFIVFLISIGLGLSSIYFGFRQIDRQAEIPQSFSIAASQLNEWLNCWTQVNGSVAKMLPSPSESRTTTEVSPEVSAYSFDRVVVCDSAAIAQVLIANNFHFENNCAVLSVTGYPQSIFSTVLEMLRRNPDLKVYALHDASPKGVGLVHHLNTSPNWFQNPNVMIYDLGLLPRQILASRNMYVRSSNESIQEAKQMPDAVRQSLSADELKWLELGNFVELESFSPKRLLQVVTQGIAKSRDPNSADSLVAIDGGGSDVYVFSSDSFG